MASVASRIVESSASACPVCDGVPDAARLPYQNPDHAGLPADADPFVDVEIRFCPTCGFGWATPPVAGASLNRYYESLYWTNPSRGDIRPVL